MLDNHPDTELLGKSNVKFEGKLPNFEWTTYRYRTQGHIIDEVQLFVVLSDSLIDGTVCDDCDFAV